MRNIGQDRIRSLVIPICSFQEMSEVVDRLEATLTEIESIEKGIAYNLRQVQALRQSILKKAFSGQLVPQDPNDEPASDLLERIQAEKRLTATTPKKTKKRLKEMTA